MKVSVFDIDGTLSKGFFIVEFPKMLCNRDAFVQAENDEIQKIYKAYSTHEPYKGKLLDYEEFAWLLVDAFGRGIKGQSVSKIEELGNAYVANSFSGFSFSKGLVALVKKKGYKPIAVSGSPYEVIRPFAETLGIEETYATRYVHSKEEFTGEVEQNCAIDTEKEEVTDGYFIEHSVDVNKSTGFGDSDHDLGFLKRVGYAVAVKPNAKLREFVDEQMKQGIKRWLIVDNDSKVLNDVDAYLP